jgi:hypothetical protein
MCCAEGEACVDLLPEVKKVKGDDGDKKKTKFQEEIEKLKMLQYQNHAVEDESANKKDGDGNDEKKDDSAKEGVEEQRKTSPTSPAHQPERNEPSTNLKPVEEKDTKEGSTDNSQTKSSSSVGERASETTTAVQPNATLNPPAQTNNNAAPTPQRVRPPAVAPAAVNNNFVVAADAPIISDSLLNGMIGFFAVIVIVLLRQSQALVDELQMLGRDD